MNCPSCGAGIGFRSERAPYTVCSSCQTMVVRRNMDVEALGKVAECQPDGSPISIGTQGGYSGKAFQVIGRIQLVYKGGFWNEWYLQFSDGSNGWLGEALGQYFISFPEADATAFSDFRALELGVEIDYDDRDWIVLDKKTVSLSSFEGEIPYVIENRSPFLTIDLRNVDGEGLTVDFSNAEASLYRGRWMRFSELELSGLTRPADPMVAVPASETVSVKCSSCGAPHEITAPGRSQLLVCQYCDASLDASSPELTALGDMMDKASEIAKWAKIPIGTTANFSDGQYKVIGMMQSSTSSYGVTYRWKDYLLYNHLTGYRWINETNGHYIFIEQLYAVPESSRSKRRGFSFKNRPVGIPTPQYILVDGKKNLHFSTAEVQVEKVVGEFYWRVQTGESSIIYDYIDPPCMVSASVGKDDITWTKGRYLDKAALAEIFPTVEFSDEPRGVASAQPNPYIKARKAMSLPLLVAFLAAIVMIASGLFLPNGQQSVAKGSLEVARKAGQGSGSGEGQAFTLEGKGRRDLAIRINSELKDRWIDAKVSIRSSKSRYKETRPLVLADYSGQGVKSDTVVLRNAPAGEPLKLVVQGQTGPPGTPPLIIDGNDKPAPLTFSLNYDIDVLPGQRAWSGLFYFWLLCLVPLWWVRSGRNKFEKKRWYESDYG